MEKETDKLTLFLPHSPSQIQKKVVYLKQQFKYKTYETNTFFSWNTSDCTHPIFYGMQG